MKLPIRHIPNTDPPIFKWEQDIGTAIGAETIEHEGVLPTPVEGAVIALIKLAEKQAKEVETLKKELNERKEDTNYKVSREVVNSQLAKPSLISSSKKGK